MVAGAEVTVTSMPGSRETCLLGLSSLSLLYSVQGFIGPQNVVLVFGVSLTLLTSLTWKAQALSESCGLDNGTVTEVSARSLQC